jgi:hypothetical protein
MPGTADPDRIRRIRREYEYARFSDSGVLAAYPNAQDGFQQVRESYFSDTADAQILIDELASVIGTEPRRHEAAETDSPLDLGSSIPLTPTLPQAHMVDRRTALDRNMVIKGLAVDRHTDRNSIETVG